MTELQDDLKKLRTLIQKMGWSEFMMHIGSILAEQADKTTGDQSSALFACSNTVHALRDAWTGCGRFVYPPDMVDCTCKCAPEEHGPNGCKTWYGDRNTGFGCNCDWRPEKLTQSTDLTCPSCKGKAPNGCNYCNSGGL